MTKSLLSSFLLLSVFSLQAYAKLHSVYTSVEEKACAIYESSAGQKHPEIDFLEMECPGLGGYQVMVSGGDLRYPLSLIYRGKEIDLSRFRSFHEANSGKVEWLFERSKEGKVNYKALIHRINYDASNYEGASMLVVTKLDNEKTCPVAVVKSSSRMNDQARAIAEKVDTMKCIDVDSIHE